MQRTFDVFVPGRVCLFGEHSDWSGAYRRFNSAIPPGKVIIAGTNQGLSARVTAHRDSFVFRSTLPDGSHVETVLPMQRDALLQEAGRGEFFSYAAGVAYHMLTFYEVGGIEIDNYQTTLPVKKGLSSSAALCVLVARCFNHVYDLKLTTRAEMEAAYQGEILTPSRCGRMDQGCAYGQVPVLMVFDGEFLHASQLNVGAHFHLLIGDLKGSKDTIRILADLNRAYPFAEDEVGHRVQDYLGAISASVVDEAVSILKRGDPAALGKLMSKAQKEFDRHLIPACPGELTAPRLHAVLEDKTVRLLTYGGKGVGSQGDGCVQLVARTAEARERLAGYLRETYGMDCFPLDIRPPKTVRKAVIPAAGFGTRMFPATKVVQKEWFPLVTQDGMCKPVILCVVEEAIDAGIEEIALIVRSGEENVFRSFFNSMPQPEHYNRLPDRAQKLCHYLQEIGRRITLIPQEEQHGFGHAVLCAAEWVGNEPFLLLLGDHLYASRTEVSAARQVITAFEINSMQSVIGLCPVPVEHVTRYGTAAGEWLDQSRGLISIQEFAEKPSPDYARSNLVTEGLPEDHFLCAYGQYVLTPEIFRYLATCMETELTRGGELQMNAALDALRQNEGLLGYVVEGERYDTDMPEGYLEALVSWHAGRRVEING